MCIIMYNAQQYTKSFTLYAICLVTIHNYESSPIVEIPRASMNQMNILNYITETQQTVAY